MPNVNVFRGSDAVIELAQNSETQEGAFAERIKNSFQLSPVGRATNVTVQVETDVAAFHELGRRYPTELRPGNINISGTIERAHINGALLTLLLGDGATSNPGATFIQPTFDIVLKLVNPALFPADDPEQEVSSTITIHDVKFQNWAFNIPEDDFVMESVSFKAVWISTEDRPAPSSGE